ncbi:hypothetical protein FSP39_020339 [Pinctada imbricata]|uniref:Uncharacterized protein n=1 Tax=Pinctada imbricata TaxID=66713 RepID=A0AA88Y6F7_PINIB|nr:hypothetical protein FSP39_020339 [Pinctada imbricata]
MKLERDKGYHNLVKVLENLNEQDEDVFESESLKLLSNSESTWETKHGGLMIAKALLIHGTCSDDFLVDIKDGALKLLDDDEFRVRIASGEVMGALCRKIGPDMFNQSKSVILGGIKSNLERESLNESELKEQEDTERLMSKLSSSPSRSTSADEIFHDTAGWKSLETWMKCLQSVVEGCGHLFNPHVDQELLDLIFQALDHTNRFVRETGYYVCGSLVSIGVNQTDKETLSMEGNSVYKYGEQLSKYLAKGLADNWSQVRLAASVATRKFLQSLPTEEAKARFFPILLPRMCLNRYYVAEGVRIYSQDTWRQVTEGEGRHLVEKHIKVVVEYYVEATGADNHAVREAACACIAELGSKASTACVACGNFVLCFPEESRASMPALYPLFFNNLQDNIASVRQGAALALSNVVNVYGQDSLNEIVTKMKEGFNGVEKQPETSEKYSDLDKGPATYGVVKKLRDNDMELHTDKQMYSCGSLAPKMGRGSRGGGCMDHKFRKPPEPWELADGCIHLLAELSTHQDLAQTVNQLLPLLAKSVTYQHYPQHVTYYETLCKQLPNIAKGLGKRHFKMHLESFFDCIFYSSTCDNALTSSAASQCLNQLSSFLGPSILRGRVEQYNPRFVFSFFVDVCRIFITSLPNGRCPILITVSIIHLTVHHSICMSVSRKYFNIGHICFPISIFGIYTPLTRPSYWYMYQNY